LVAGPHADGQERQVERRGAARHRTAVLGTDEGRKLPLEGGHLGALRDPAAQDGAAGGRHLPLVHLGVDDRDHAATVAFARHHSTRRLSPSRRSTCARKPKRRSAFVVSARRRGTGLTLRSGPYSGRRVEFIVASSASASPLRLVSRPLPTLNTSSVTSDCSARMFARATSSM